LKERHFQYALAREHFENLASPRLVSPSSTMLHASLIDCIDERREKLGGTQPRGERKGPRQKSRRGP
jgi:hypothetical protein